MDTQNKSPLIELSQQEQYEASILRPPLEELREKYEPAIKNATCSVGDCNAPADGQCRQCGRFICETHAKNPNGKDGKRVVYHMNSSRYTYRNPGSLGKVSVYYMQCDDPDCMKKMKKLIMCCAAFGCVFMTVFVAAMVWLVTLPPKKKYT